MPREYTLSELAAAVGMTERNVRAYRSRGLIRPPRLRGRVGYYSFDHLTQLRLVQALTGRGLSLQVVAQLIERGRAQHELARLIREELPEGPPVPLAPDVTQEVSRSDPEVLDTLADHGVVCRTEEGFRADPALLTLASQLAAHGTPVVEVAHVMLSGAQAAEAAAESVYRGLQARRPVPDEEGRRTTAVEIEADPRPRHRQQGRAGAYAEPSEASDAAATTVAVELAAMAFRIALEARLSRPGP